MKRTRHFLLSVTLSAALLLPALPTRGQGAAITFDPTQAANMLRQFIEGQIEHSETLAQIAKQIEEAKKMYQFMDAAYKFTSTFISDSQILKETYENYQYIRNDIEAVQSQYQYYANGGKITPRRMYYTAMVVDRVAGDAYDEFRFLRDEVMSDKYKDLSHKDRMDLFAQSARKFRRYHTLLGQVIADNWNAVHGAQMNESAQKDTDAALGSGGDGTDGVFSGDVDKIVVEVQQKEDPASQIAGVKMEDLESQYRDKDLAASILKFVSYVILALALLMIPFNLARSRQGEHQTENALFKVAGGLFVIAMLLQVLSILLFNQKML